MKRMNFRRRLLVVLIPIVVLAMGGLMVGSYLESSHIVVRQQEANLQQAVEKTVRELEVWVEDRERGAMVFAQNNVFKDACLGQHMEEAQALLTAYHKLSPVYENLFVADANGKLLVDSIGGKSVGIEISKIPIFAINAQKAAQGKPWVGAVAKSPATGRPVCLITAPIVSGGKTIGIMGTPVELMVFSDAFIGDTKIGEKGYLFMADEKGAMLAHPDKSTILKINMNDNDFSRRMVALKNGMISYKWNGVEKTAIFSTYDKKGWIVVGTISNDEFLAPLNRLQRVSGIFGLVALGLIVLVTWFSTSGVFKVIKSVVTDLRQISSQMSDASRQVAESGQSLAEGASEQAASLEETSSSLEEMAAMTKQNADHARQADQLMKETNTVVEAATGSMTDLTVSMEQITKASRETSKIVKTIDEIAFQTNLLALNAAVEAARAGEAGAGFAVVAGEVRNLALRAAEAARNTANLIEDTVKRVENGSVQVSKTAEAFSQVSASSMKIGELVSEIAAASNEQAQGIQQVNTAIAEMDTVTQKNASSAEESASAAEEMSAQSIQMKDIVGDLAQLVVGGKRRKTEHEDSSPVRSGSVPSRSYEANGKMGVRKAMQRSGRAVSPEEIIPLNGDDLSDF